MEKIKPKCKCRINVSTGLLIIYTSSRFLEYSSLWSFLKDWEVMAWPSCNCSLASVIVQCIPKVVRFPVNPSPDVRIAFEKIVRWVKNWGLLWCRRTSAAMKMATVWRFENWCFFPRCAISLQAGLHHFDFLVESLFHFFHAIPNPFRAICSIRFPDYFRCMWFAQTDAKCIWNSVALYAEVFTSLQVEGSSLCTICEIRVALQEIVYPFSEEA